MNSALRVALIGAAASAAASIISGYVTVQTTNKALEVQKQALEVQKQTAKQSLLTAGINARDVLISRLFRSHRPLDEAGLVLAEASTTAIDRVRIAESGIITGRFTSAEAGSDGDWNEKLNAMTLAQILNQADYEKAKAAFNVLGRLSEFRKIDPSLTVKEVFDGVNAQVKILESIIKTPDAAKN